jgi:hypothetical protein
VGTPEQCMHIGDRESDMSELFCLAQEQRTPFLLLLCVDHIAGDGTTLISEFLVHAPVQGHHCLQVTDKRDKQREANLQRKFLLLVVPPPPYKKRAYLALSLTVIEV